MLDKKISNVIRKSAHTLLETKIMVSILLLSTLVVGSLTYLPIYATGRALFLDYNWNGKQHAPWLVSTQVN